VKTVEVDGIERRVEAGCFRLQGRETCEEEIRRQLFVDGLSGAEDPSLAGYLDFPASEASADSLGSLAAQEIVVLPPKVRASGVARQAVATAIGRIEADKVLEEAVELEAVDLCYRPIYAFRYRRGSKEAVVEVDALTGEVRTQGSTFEEHLGKILEPKFLLDIGAEAANIFIPGATVAKLAIRKGMELREGRKATKTP
jgi:hypothetical protein